MARLTMLTYPTFGDLTGTPATLADLVATLSPLPRDEIVRVPIHVLNALAVDNHLKDDQADLINRLEPALRDAYDAFIKTDPEAIFRPFHPIQQLVFLHAASRFCKGAPGSLTPEDVQQRYTRACIQINDSLLKTDPDKRGDAILYLFSEQGPQWDLMNNSHPIQSIGRLRHLLIEMPARGGPSGEAAGRIRDQFPDYLGLPFDTVFNLTAFLIFWWHLHAKENPGAPASCIVDRRTWLTNSTISKAEMDAFLDRISTSPEELVQHFDKACKGMTFHDVMPFRQRPLFRIDDNILGFISPQFIIEKGGVDLFWLLTNQQPGVPEPKPWMDDFGAVIEGYVNDIISGLPAPAVGGRYVSFAKWTDFKQRSGEIDALLHEGEVLVVVETKASLLRQSVLSSGNETEVEKEIDKKFVVGEGKKAKGVAQIVRTIEFLSTEKKYKRPFEGVDLSQIKFIIPVLVVADRSLRFPPLARWFHRRFQALLGKCWGQMGPLILCSLEDLESMEQRAVAGHGSLMTTFVQYAKEYPKAEGPISDIIGPRQNQRLRGLATGWMDELVEKKVLPLK